MPHKLRKSVHAIIMPIIGRDLVAAIATIFVTAVPCGLSANSQTADLSPETLLGLYREATSMTKRIAFNAETVTTQEGDIQPGELPTASVKGPWQYKFEYRRDNDRWDVRQETVTIGANGKPKLHTASRKRSILAGGQWRHFLSRDDDKSTRLLVAKRTTDQWGAWTREMLSSATALDGIPPGAAGRTFWDVMSEEGASLKLRPAMEVVDGHKTYVLESKGRYGEHVLWIDPEAGYNARRISVRKTGKDLLDDEPVDTPPPILPAKFVQIYPQVPIEEFEFVVDSIKIERVGDVFLQTEATLTRHRKYTDGRVVTRRSAHRRRGIDLDPDFEAMGAFVLDGIPDHTPVFNKDHPDIGVEFEWYQGNIVAKMDASVVDEIEGMMARELVARAAIGANLSRARPSMPSDDSADSRETLTPSVLGIASERADVGDPKMFGIPGMMLALMIVGMLLLGTGFWVVSQRHRRSNALGGH